MAPAWTGFLLVFYISCMKSTLASVEFSCSGKSGLNPHPSSCSMFIVCVFGTQYTMMCPSGLHFNPAAKVCDWPTNTVCTLPTSVATTVQPKPSLCNAVDLCPPQVGYYQFPDWSNCSAYYACARGVLSRAECPTGLVYDFMKWTCAYATDVTCSKS